MTTAACMILLTLQKKLCFQLCLAWWPLQGVFLLLFSGFWDRRQHFR